MHPDCMPDEEQIKDFLHEQRYQKIVRDLKSEVNEFLFSRVPDKMTMKEFEGLAREVFNKIWEKWE